MPQEYIKAGISFQYPDNWELEESAPDLGNRNVSVTSPEGPFWVVSLHPNANPPHRLADAVLETMKQEFDGVEVDPLKLTLSGRELSGYEINFYCADLTNTAYILAFRDHRATYLVMWQAEDHDWDEFEPMFEAVTSSFLSGLEN